MLTDGVYIPTYGFQTKARVVVDTTTGCYIQKLYERSELKKRTTERFCRKCST